MNNEQENPMPPDMSKLEAEMAQAAEREHWREVNALADKADEAEFTESDPLVRRLRGRADFLRNSGEVKTPELLEAAAKELESPAPEGVELPLPHPDASVFTWTSRELEAIKRYGKECVRAALAAPAPQAAPVALTDEEIASLWSEAYNDATGRRQSLVFARAIEAAHGITQTKEPTNDR